MCSLVVGRSTEGVIKLPLDCFECPRSRQSINPDTGSQNKQTVAVYCGLAVGVAEWLDCCIVWV